MHVVDPGTKIIVDYYQNQLLRRICCQKFVNVLIISSPSRTERRLTERVKLSPF